MSNALALRNAAFSPEIENLQIAWDSTSLGTLKECPRKYWLSMIQGWAPRSESVHLTFGRIYHSALEAYDHARSAGKEHSEALRAAVRHALCATWTPSADGSGRPWASEDPNKNRATLLRSIIWYLLQFREDSITTIQLANGKPAVELSFRVALDFVASDGQPYLLCGHLDRLGLFQEEPHILDRKTTKATISSDFFTRFAPDNQFQIYDLAGQLVYNIATKGIIVDAAQVAVTFSRFQRGFVQFTSSQREEFYEELGVWFGVAAGYARMGVWPKNEKSCGNYGGCSFRPICSRPPSVRAEWLAAGYVQRVWDPLKTRGDI